MTSLKHLKPLSKLKSSKGIEFLTPTVLPGNHCPMRMASVITRDIAGVSSLLIGMEECTIHSRLFNPSPEGDKGELHWLYLLSSNEVVFGCREGLMDAIGLMSSKGVKYLMLIVTCVPELIGEDIEGIAKEAKNKYDIEIGFAKLGQFKNVSFPPGYRKTLEEIVKFIDPKEPVEKRVNILGRKEDEDHIVEPFIIKQLSEVCQVNYLAPGTDIEKFRESSDGSLNIVLSSYTLPMAEKMEEKLNIPYISLYDKYSIADIKEVYGSIDEILGTSFYEDSSELEKLIREKEDLVKEKVKDMSYVLANRLDNPMPFANYLNSLGMIPKLIHLEDYYEEDKINVSKILDLGHDPLICRMVNREKDIENIDLFKPDFCFGYMDGKMKNTRQIGNMMEFYGQVGLNRTDAILDKIIEVLSKEEKDGII